MTDVATMAKREPLADECRRFEKVMQAQAQPRMLVDLFDKLVVSVKFSDEAKPWCFGLLVQECALKLSDRSIPAFLEAIDSTKAVEQMRQVYSWEEGDKMLQKTALRATRLAGQDGQKILDVWTFFERTKISVDRSHTYDLLFHAGMPLDDELGVLCDLVFPIEYGFKQKTSAELDATEAAIPF